MAECREPEQKVALKVHVLAVARPKPEHDTSVAPSLTPVVDSGKGIASIRA
jgi:hypothetical protein